MMLFLLLSLQLHGLLAADDAPATQPSDVARWLDQLADLNSQTRAAARRALMDISAEQLLELRQLVANGRAVLPAQREPLYEIVKQAYLRNAPYAVSQEKDERSFIGLLLNQNVEPVSQDIAGITFKQRLLGFDSYRVLEDHDIILGVEELPSERFGEGNVLEAIRKKFAPGDKIHLRIIRDNEVMVVELRLSARPLNRQLGELSELNARDELAQLYWQREFAPLLERRPS